MYKVCDMCYNEMADGATHIPGRYGCEVMASAEVQAECSHPEEYMDFEQDNNGGAIAECSLCGKDVTSMIPAYDYATNFGEVI